MKIHRTSKEQGYVIVFTLVAALVLGVVLLGLIQLSKNEGQLTGRSENWNAAMPLVEAGIEEALTHLRYAPTNRAANGWVFEDDQYKKTRTFGSGFYEVSISTNYDPIIISRAGARAPTQTKYTIFRTVRVQATNQPMFTAALEAPVSIVLKGNGTHIDSYDSMDPKYSLPNGGYDPDAPKDGGDVVCYGGAGAMDIGNGNINGKLKTGPDTTYSVGPNGSVGSLTWNGSGVQDGWSEEVSEAEYPPVTAPTGGVRPPAGQGDYKDYQYVLGSSVYEVNDVSGSILVTGSNAVLLVKSTLTMAPKDSILIQPGANLILYVEAADAKLSGIANGNTDALKFQYYGLPSNVSISMGGNAAFVGVMYAPNAILNLNGGGGGSSVDFSGAIIAKSVKINGHYNFHYDEATRRFGSRGIIASSWDEL